MKVTRSWWDLLDSTQWHGGKYSLKCTEAVIHQVDRVLILSPIEQLLLRSTAKWTCMDALVVEVAERAESTLSGKCTSG